jgi:citrate lyase subunit beta/citryl-CoA lyase
LVQLRSREESMDIRSKLFVPGSRPELFAKALAGAADALSFDLEDSVVADQKEEARHAIASFMQESAGEHNKVVIVRVNAGESGLLESDISAMVVPGIHVINLPKIESAKDVLEAVELVEAAEDKASMKIPIRLLANIETPKGLRNAYEIATAHPRLMGLQIGFLDMSRACGFESGNRTALNDVRMKVRLAASEAGIAAFDGAYANVKDQDGFRAEAEEARSFGITGKSCIHPSQIALANEVFAPGSKAIEAASRIVKAASLETEKGTGAFLFEGKMVDKPVIEQAQALLNRASKFGMLREESK